MTKHEGQGLLQIYEPETWVQSSGPMPAMHKHSGQIAAADYYLHHCLPLSTQAIPAASVPGTNLQALHEMKPPSESHAELFAMATSTT